VRINLRLISNIIVGIHILIDMRFDLANQPSVKLFLRLNVRQAMQHLLTRLSNVLHVGF
jgi:hypothetical protein